MTNQPQRTDDSSCGHRQRPKFQEVSEMSDKRVWEQTERISSAQGAPDYPPRFARSVGKMRLDRRNLLPTCVEGAGRSLVSEASSVLVVCHLELLQRPVGAYSLQFRDKHGPEEEQAKRTINIEHREHSVRISRIEVASLIAHIL